MQPWQILIIVAIAVAWHVYRRYIKKVPSTRESIYPPIPEVEDWYKDARSKITELDKQSVIEKEERWQSMSSEDKQQFSEEFIREKFGERAVNGYNLKQKLQLGLAHYIIGEDEEK